MTEDIFLYLGLACLGIGLFGLIKSYFEK